MGTRAVVVGMVVTFTAALAPAEPILELVRRVDLREELGREPAENTLKLFRSVVDPTTGRVLVSGIMTPHVAVLDGTSDHWVDSIDTAGAGHAYRYLALDPVAQVLFVHDGSNHTLTAVHLGRHEVVGPVSVPAAVGTVLPASDRGELFLVCGESPGFRVLDGATLEPVRSSDAMGTGVAAMVREVSSGDLYLLDARDNGPGGTLYRFDPVALRVEATIPFDLASGERAKHLHWGEGESSLITVVQGRRLLRLGLDGATLAEAPLPADRELEDLVSDPARGRLLVSTVARPEGAQVAGVDGHLLTYDLDDLALEGDLAVGRKIHSLSLDPASGRVYLPNGDAATLWAVGLDRSVAALHLGDSVEGVVALEGGRPLVMNSRLGGSYLMTYDVGSHRIDTFTAGAWPVPLLRDPAGDTLLVLNAWDGTVSVYSTARGRRLLGTVELGLPAGTTDRLPDLAVDSSRRLAFAAFPEHAAVATVDWATLSPGPVAAVAGIAPGDTGGGPGQLQVEVDEDRGEVWVVARSNGVTTVLDADRGLLAVADMTLPAPALDIDGVHILFVDRERRRLFAGPLEIDLETTTLSGRALPEGHRVVAADGGRYWTTAESAGRVVVAAVDRDSLALEAVFDVGAADGPAPAVTFVPEQRLMVIGWMTTATLDLYHVGSRVRSSRGRLGG